jgi:antitoxin (DNA-binding transcriptional repressor) of toxin-antitoxin stability system
MPQKSNYGPQRISATEASRSFSKLLDLVERGRRFLIHRHGRDVCAMSAPLVEERRASACLELLRERTPVFLDDRFSTDLLDIVAGEPLEERPAWDS